MGQFIPVENIEHKQGHLVVGHIIQFTVFKKVVVSSVNLASGVAEIESAEQPDHQNVMSSECHATVRCSLTHPRNFVFEYNIYGLAVYAVLFHLGTVNQRLTACTVDESGIAAGKIKDGTNGVIGKNRTFMTGVLDLGLNILLWD